MSSRGENMDDANRVLEDLIHQLRGPLYSALARMNALLAKDPPHAIERELRIVRGLCQKANRVAASAGLFRVLHSESPAIAIDAQTLSASQLTRLLIECASDAEALIDPSRRIKVWVDQESFRNTDLRLGLRADPSLLSQAVRNVLDNAAKYSFPNTTVDVSGRMTRKGTFALAVANIGIAIRADEVIRCLEHGWRGVAAQTVTSEGSGIGLWIAHHLMLAHGGEVRVMPTTADNLTRVELVFPLHGELS